MERPSPISVTEQEKIVRNTTTKYAYGEFISNHFVGESWLFQFRVFAPQNPTEDYIRFFTMGGVLGVRLGIPNFNGALSIDKIAMFESVASPRRQLSLMCHLSSMQLRIDQLRQELSEQFKNDENAQYWLQGTFIKLSKGQKVDTSTKTISKAIDNRSKRKVPIFESDPQMAQALSDIGFSIKDACGMSPSEFATDVLPRVGVVFERICDVSNVFQDDKPLSLSKPKYYY